MIPPVRSLAAAALGALLLTPALTGIAHAAPSKVMTVAMAKTETEMKKVAEYWRPERLKAADSYTPATPAGKAPAPSSTAGGTSGGSRGSGGTSVPAAALRAKKVTTAPGDIAPALPKGAATAKTIGKVFFLFHNKEFWCTASAVASKSKSVVATAGHCAYDPREPGEAKNWIFVPNPGPDGTTPDGIYVGASLSLHEDWAGKGDYDFDYAFVTVHRGFTWEKQKDGSLTMKDVGKLQDNTGGQGLAISKGYGQRINAFGYPAGPQPDGSRPFNGKTLEACQGGTSKTTAPTRELQYGVLLQPCNMTAGASGGPWLWKYQPGTKLGYLNGVNSLTWNRDARGAFDAVSAPPFIATTAEVYRQADAQGSSEK
ncbi:trypsin-like serine peptidase [Nonomuraea typhae]|uniref:trypsin-like serine peptidase n=1 Tax=Nonomuraea typhae TaxID=2603600 RepID=UPI0012F9FD58|nr:trypsin-like peptidase domain-containing protein [Nonomuraea typhae]